MTVKAGERVKVIAVNRRATHDYFVDERLEAGLVLTGTEIKSIREGRVNLREGYARVTGNEAWLVNVHIAPYEQGNRYNHEPRRTRKLLLHSDQIAELVGRTQAKGQTVIPLRLYIRDGHAKLELGIGRGKKVHDKRRTIAERDRRRELERETKERVKL